jgi:hypothetical protein
MTPSLILVSAGHDQTQPVCEAPANERLRGQPDPNSSRRTHGRTQEAHRRRLDTPATRRPFSSSRGLLETISGLQPLVGVGQVAEAAASGMQTA